MPQNEGMKTEKSVSHKRNGRLQQNDQQFFIKYTVYVCAVDVNTKIHAAVENTSHV